MTGVEDLVRDAYLASQQARVSAPDEAALASLVRAARARRRARAITASAAAALVVAGIAIGADRLADLTVVPANSPTPVPSASASSPVNYVTALPGVTPVDPAALGQPAAPEAPGRPALYPLSQEVLDQAGPGWGYAIFAGKTCDEPTGDGGTLALVSPDGSAFDAGAIPADSCSTLVVGGSGALVVVASQYSDTDQPIFVANALAGSVSRVETGVEESIADQTVVSGGTGLIAFRVNEGKPVVVSLAADGSQSIIDLGQPYLSQAYSWGQAEGSLVFAVHRDTDIPLWGWAWYALAQGATAPESILITVPAGVTPSDDCEYEGTRLTGLVFACEFDAEGNPTAYFEVDADGAVSAIEPPVNDTQNLESSVTDAASGPLGGRVTFDWGSGPVTVLDPTALDPTTELPWEAEPSIGGSATRVTGTVEGILASVTQPDGGYAVVVALAEPDGTMVVLPSVIGGVANSLTSWEWLGAQ